MSGNPDGPRDTNVGDREPVLPVQEHPIINPSVNATIRTPVVRIYLRIRP